MAGSSEWLIHDDIEDTDKVDVMLPVYVLIAYITIYTVFGFMSSFLSEFIRRKRTKPSSNYFASWLRSLWRCKTYYYAFALHVFDEATSLASIMSMYCICEATYGSDRGNWTLLTSQPKPSMLLLLSVIVWCVYKFGSLVYLVTIDIFSWAQVSLHFIDCNYLFEMHLAHSEGNKNPIIEWMHRQYIYLCSIPLWFLQFVFLLRWGDDGVLLSHSSSLFACILVSVLFGLANIFYVMLWCDMSAFSSECVKWYSRGFRLRLALRGCQFISRMVWLSYFWIFVGSVPFFILLLIFFVNHIYLYFCGYFGELYYVLSTVFVIADMSSGVGYVNSTNHGKVNWLTKILYMATHCAGCMIGIWVIVEEDLLYIDMLCWLHWFEDLLMWAIITGICDGHNALIMGAQRDALWQDIWVRPTYEAFYALGIITWFFGGAYYLVVRCEDFIDRNKQSLSISQGILGLAQSGQWESLSKFLPRMKKISLNRKNILDDNKTAIHYAIAQNQWKIVRQLMQYGANVNICDRNHQTAVHLICANRSLDDMALFEEVLGELDGDPVAKRDNNGATILHLICENGSERLSLKQRLTFYMKRFGEFEININIADNNGCTPLHYIVEETNDIECCEILIENGAQIDCEDNKKQTPLIHCVSKNQNNPTTLRFLLSNGANINHRDDKGWTALHFAANSNLTDNVFILLEHFPDITIRNNAGKNAYNLANSMGHTTIADTLQMNMPVHELRDNVIAIKIEKEKEKEKEEEEHKEEEEITIDNHHDTPEEEEKVQITVQPDYTSIASVSNTHNNQNNSDADPDPDTSFHD